MPILSNNLKNYVKDLERERDEIDKERLPLSFQLVEDAIEAAKERLIEEEKYNNQGNAEGKKETLFPNPEYENEDNIEKINQQVKNVEGTAKRKNFESAKRRKSIQVLKHDQRLESENYSERVGRIEFLQGIESEEEKRSDALEYNSKESFGEASRKTASNEMSVFRVVDNTVMDENFEGCESKKMGKVVPSPSSTSPFAYSKKSTELMGDSNYKEWLRIGLDQKSDTYSFKLESARAETSKESGRKRSSEGNMRYSDGGDDNDNDGDERRSRSSQSHSRTRECRHYHAARRDTIQGSNNSQSSNQSQGDRGHEAQLDERGLKSTDDVHDPVRNLARVQDQDRFSDQSQDLARGLTGIDVEARDLEPQLDQSQVRHPYPVSRLFPVRSGSDKKGDSPKDPSLFADSGNRPRGAFSPFVSTNRGSPRVAPGRRSIFGGAAEKQEISSVLHHRDARDPMTELSSAFLYPFPRSSLVDGFLRVHNPQEVGAQARNFDASDGLGLGLERERRWGKRSDTFLGDGYHAQRKARRCWSPDLHRRFLDALNQLGGAHVATPKQIRELMKVDGLTNDEVKSHLQKYRLHTRRPEPVFHQSENPLSNDYSPLGQFTATPPALPARLPPGMALKVDTTYRNLASPEGSVFSERMSHLQSYMRTLDHALGSYPRIFQPQARNITETKSAGVPMADEISNQVRKSSIQGKHTAENEPCDCQDDDADDEDDDGNGSHNPNSDSQNVMTESASKANAEDEHSSIK